jgi:hypothetical protein
MDKPNALHHRSGAIMPEHTLAAKKFGSRRGSNDSTSNGCTQPAQEADDECFELVHDEVAIEKKLGRELTIGEVLSTLNEWYRVSPISATSWPNA